MKHTKFVQDDRRARERRAEDVRFADWLSRGGWRVTAVPGDRAWNLAAVKATADHISGR